MKSEIKENFEEKLRLAVNDLIEDLDTKSKAMHAKHASEGLLRSGNTIKRTMDFIEEANRSLYSAIFEHISTLSIIYYPEIEADVQALANNAQDSLRQQMLPRFKKSAELAGNPSLYERMLPEVEAGFSKSLANFQNQLNAVAVNLKEENTRPQYVKALWALEAALITVSMFIVGMWFKDPSGNYEPMVVGLSLAVALVGVGIRVSSKK